MSTHPWWGSQNVLKHLQVRYSDAKAGKDKVLLFVVKARNARGLQDLFRVAGHSRILNSTLLHCETQQQRALLGVPSKV